MGQLSATIGALTRSLPFDDARGAAIVNGFIEAQGGPVDGTNAEKLTWYVERIAEYTRDTYRQHKRRTLSEAAEVQAEQELEEW